MEKKSMMKPVIGFILSSILISTLQASSAVASTEEVDFIKNTISSHKIVIFSKSYCPYCKKAKSVFKELDVEPYVVELNERDDGSSIQDALSGIVGRRTVPQVFIDGKHIGGSDDTVEAYQSGKLAKLLGITSDDEDDSDVDEDL
ncbi:Glutaredoxin-C4-like protein [Drosera capensis]